MSTFTLFVNGLGLTRRKRRLAFRLWAINILFAIPLAAPFFFLAHGQLSHSLSAGSVLKKLDVNWLTDFSSRFLDAAPAFAGLVVLAVCIYLLLAVFLNGGIIGALNRPEAGTTLAEFFHDGGLYFWRLLRLFLLSIPAYLLFLGACFPVVRALLEAVNRRATTEWLAIAAANARLLSLVLLLGLVAMFFDYVKIGLVTGNRSKVLAEAWRTLKFLKRRFFRAWGLYLLAGLAFVVLTLLYLEVARILPKGTPMLVLLAFLWQQSYVLGRQFSKVLFFATEIEFTRQHNKTE
jgi:hypothetical protein